MPVAGALRRSSTKSETRRPAGRTPLEFRIGDWPMHYIHVIQRQMHANLNHTLRRAGINSLTWRILAALSGRAEQTIGQVADMTVLDRSNLGRLLDVLEAEGLVEKIVAPGDRRASLVRITAAGRQRYQAALPLVLEDYRRLLAGIDDGDRRALMRALRRMKANSLAIWDETLHDDGGK